MGVHATGGGVDAPAEVFVRELAPFEGQRPMILLASNTLMSAPEIAEMWMTDDSQVRKVIHDFNLHGFESLRPRFRGGRPRRISIDDEQRIVAVAGARPDTLGVPYTRWSLAKLSRYLRGQGIVVSPAQLGRILARNGISLQRTRSWKQSPDPDYAAKAARVLALYREQPKNGVVISFDEKGPESLCPKHGRGWARRGRPERHRATFNRRQGIRYLVGALDVHADYLDWDAFGHALADHIRYRNSPAERERRKLEAANRRQRRAANTTSELKL